MKQPTNQTLNINIHSLFSNLVDSPITGIEVADTIPLYSGYFNGSTTVGNLKKIYFEHLLSKNLMMHADHDNKSKVISNKPEHLQTINDNNKFNQLLESILENYVLVNTTHKDNNISTKLIGNRKFTIKSRNLNSGLSKRVKYNSITVRLQKVVKNGTILVDDMTLDSIPSDIYCNMELNEENHILPIYAVARHHFTKKKSLHNSNNDFLQQSPITNDHHDYVTFFNDNEFCKSHDDGDYIEKSSQNTETSSTHHTFNDILSVNCSFDSSNKKLELPIDKTQYSKSSSSDNLVNMAGVTPEVVQQKLQSRFTKFRIYTDFGPILIAINPFRYLPIYNPRYMKQYSNDCHHLAPHIFSVAAKVYEKLLTTQINQCIVISGVSGSGKTESAKFLMQQLLYMANSERESYIESITNSAIQILEGFGNAVTESNDNASRFGLVTQFRYSKFGQLKETRFSHYLLEKSRITNQSTNDRNFHIFYYLESGLKVSTIEKKFLIDKDTTFNYLSNESQEYKDGMNMHRTFKFKVLHRCFSTLGLEELEHEIYKILLAILYTGNINIDCTRKDYCDYLSDDCALIQVAKLLQIDKNILVNFLSMERITVKNESMNVNLTSEQSIYTRDGLAKSLYVFLFDWLLRKINQLLGSSHVPIEDNIKSILLLDIFGFENYKTNRFEQFCINYANEAMQNYMITSALQQEQELYIREGIDMEPTDYSDSRQVLQMIAGKPVSIISIIVEESLLSMGSAIKMRQKINEQYHSHSKYIQTNSSITFAIAHYAGPVVYDLSDFRTKNLEKNYSAVVKLICSSTNKNIKEILLNFDAKKQWIKLKYFMSAYFYFTKILHKPISDEKMITNFRKRLTERSSSKNLDISDDDLKSRLSSSCGGKGSSKLTVLSSFQESLNKLLNVLHDCESCFVYCIRSNKTKQEFVLDQIYCEVQLEYSGIFKGLNLLKNTFQNVFDFNEFIERFQLFVINPSKPITVIGELNEVFEHYGFEKKTYFVGKTKVFVMDCALKRIIEIDVNMYTHCIEKIELWWQTHIRSKKFKDMLKNTIFIQKVFRVFSVIRSWKPEYRNSLLIDVDNIQLSYPFSYTVEDLNDSHERLASILSNNKDYSPKVEAFKQLMSTHSEINSNYLYNTSNENDTDTDRNRTLSVKKAFSENTKFELNSDDFTKNNEPQFLIDVEAKKSYIIDVDTLDHESDCYIDSSSQKILSNKISFSTIDDELIYHDNIDPKLHDNTGTITRSFKNILNYKRKSKSKIKHKQDKLISISTHSSANKKKKSSKAIKNDSLHFKDNISLSSGSINDKKRDLIVNDHESFYIFIKYIQKYAFANQSTTSFNSSTDNLLSVFFTSLQRFTSINHAIFVNAFRFGEPVQMTINDAVNSFEDVLTKTISEQQSEFPVTMGKNSFLGLIKLYKNATKNELHQLKKDFKRIRDSFDLSKSNITNEGHMMNCATPLPGTNFCEVCNTLVWNDSYTCDYCQVVCHKRCIVKLSVICSANSGTINNNKFFQTELDLLVSNQNSIPEKLLALLQEIEKRCLNTEGIYRRQCNMEKVNNSRNILDNNPCQDIDFGGFEPLVLSSLVKLFFRQLPSPLFSRIISLELTKAGDISGDMEALDRINQILSKISKPNYLVLERLLAHLAAIAENHEVNKMTSFNLAIIFSPCLFDFESNANIAQLKLLDHQRRVIQLLIDTLGKKPSSNIPYLMELEGSDV